MTLRATGSVLALDIGMKRTGVAKANMIMRLPSTLTVLAPETLIQDVLGLIKEYEAIALVVGLPRNLEGNETEQTAYVRSRVAELADAIGPDVPIHLIDEAATSLKAEAELSARGKNFSKGDVDMLSAVYILEDFLASKEGRDV